MITKCLLTALAPGHSERLREDPSLHPGSSLLVTDLGESSLTAVQSSDQGGDKDSSPTVLKLNWEVIPGNTGSGLGKETGREGSAVGHGGSADPWERPGLYTGWGCPRAAAGGRR